MLDGININSELSEIELMYVPCPGGGKHYMIGKGSGRVVNSKGVTILRGQAAQCTKCLTVIVSEFNPFHPATKKLGKYANRGFNEEVAKGVYMQSNTLYQNNNIADMTSYTWQGR